MNRKLLFVLPLLAAGVVLADDLPGTEPAAKKTEAKLQSEEGGKLIDGMSILGNREAPKSLVLVPWKSSEIGDSLGLSLLLDESREPVDREVFLRELGYYEIRSIKTR